MKCLKSSIELVSLVLAAILVLCASNPVPATDPWRDPCDGIQGGATPNNNYSHLLQSLQESSSWIQTAAEDWKTFLTTGQNSRVPESTATMLDNMGIHVENFPHDFRSNPKQNISEVLVVDYVYLSKLYIFFHQTKLNTLSCDTKVDKTEAVNKINAILTHTRQTLCTVDIYLLSSGHPMPSEQIPDQNVVLDTSMKDLEQCTHEDSVRVSMDYVNARDTATTSGFLRTQYVELYDLLFG